jgi:phage shock protein A
MYFTLQGAADATGKAKTTIQRAIKSGKLSAKRNENGSYAIDAAELSRAYVLRDTGIDTAVMEHKAIAYDAETLRAQVELLQIQVEMMRETTQDLRVRLDSAEQERRQLMAMLTHQPNQTETKEKPISLLFEKLFGKRGRQ